MCKAVHPCCKVSAATLVHMPMLHFWHAVLLVSQIRDYPVAFRFLGAKDMGSNFYPFTAARKGNKLVTKGLFSKLVAHLKNSAPIHVRQSSCTRGRAGKSVWNIVILPTRPSLLERCALLSGSHTPGGCCWTHLQDNWTPCTFLPNVPIVPHCSFQLCPKLACNS